MVGLVKGSSHRRWVLGIVVVLGWLVLWELVVRAGLVPVTQIAAPSSLLGALRKTVADGSLGAAVAESMRHLALGMLAAILTAIPLGIIVGSSSLSDRVVNPFVTFMYAMPMAALVPLFIIAFGVGDEPKVLVVGLMAFFPLYVAVNNAVKTVDASAIRLCRSYGGNLYYLATTVIVPSLTPAIVAGLRVALARALIALIVLELYIGTGVGLGSMITVSVGLGKPDIALLGITVFALISVCASEVLVTLERRLDRWRIR